MKSHLSRGQLACEYHYHDTVLIYYYAVARYVVQACTVCEYVDSSGILYSKMDQFLVLLVKDFILD